MAIIEKQMNQHFPTLAIATIQPSTGSQSSIQALRSPVATSLVQSRLVVPLTAISLVGDPDFLLLPCSAYTIQEPPAQVQDFNIVVTEPIKCSKSFIPIFKL